MKARIVVYLRGDCQEQYSTASAPGTQEPDPAISLLTSSPGDLMQVLLWEHSQSSTVCTDANKHQSCELSYY